MPTVSFPVRRTGVAGPQLSSTVRPHYVPLMTAKDSISHDCYCSDCGYNLCGLTPHDQCPECGQQVVESLNRIHWGRHVPDRDPQRRITRGIAIALAICGLLGLLFLALLFPIRDWSPFSAVTLVIAGTLVLMFVLGFVLLKCTQPPYSVPRGSKCSMCGYDLRGITSDRCSQCGAWFSSSLASRPPADG